MAELHFKGLHFGQNLGQNFVEGLAFVCQQVGFRKAEMSTRFAALNDHKIGGAAKLLGPAAQDELCGPAAGNDGGNGNVRCIHKAGQFQRQARAGHHGVHARFHGGADGGGVVLRGDHGVDGYHACAFGDRFCFLDLRSQRAVVGADRVTGKVRFPVARIGGGDAPHAAAGRHGPGQPAEGNAHAHAALQDGHLQLRLAEGQHSAFSAAMRCLPLSYRSARMSATGRTSCSMPAT